MMMKIFNTLAIFMAFSGGDAQVPLPQEAVVNFDHVGDYISTNADLVMHMPLNMCMMDDILEETKNAVRQFERGEYQSDLMEMVDDKIHEVSTLKTIFGLEQHIQVSHARTKRQAFLGLLAGLAGMGLMGGIESIFNPYSSEEIGNFHIFFLILT